ncbi:MAG TPA: c-type cytochrome [Terriglobia bacterium]|nr:c-type cytochrome [Terriglobia bacterium]
MRLFRRSLPLLVLTGACLLAAAMSLAAAKPATPDGGSIFKDHKCIMCHGQDGKGFAAIHTPDFTDPKWQASVTDKQIADVIMSGKPNTMMKANGGGAALSDDEVQALVKFIRSLDSGKKK